MQQPAEDSLSKAIASVSATQNYLQSLSDPLAEINSAMERVAKQIDLAPFSEIAEECIRAARSIEENLKNVIDNSQIAHHCEILQQDWQKRFKEWDDQIQLINFSPLTKQVQEFLESLNYDIPSVNYEYIMPLKQESLSLHGSIREIVREEIQRALIPSEIDASEDPPYGGDGIKRKPGF